MGLSARFAGGILTQGRKTSISFVRRSRPLPWSLGVDLFSVHGVTSSLCRNTSFHTWNMSTLLTYGLLIRPYPWLRTPLSGVSSRLSVVISMFTLVPCLRYRLVNAYVPGQSPRCSCLLRSSTWETAGPTAASQGGGGTSNGRLARDS